MGIKMYSVELVVRPTSRGPFKVSADELSSTIKKMMVEPEIEVVVKPAGTEMTVDEEQKMIANIINADLVSKKTPSLDVHSDPPDWWFSYHSRVGSFLMKDGPIRAIGAAHPFRTKEDAERVGQYAVGLPVFISNVPYRDRTADFWLAKVGDGLYVCDEKPCMFRESATRFGAIEAAAEHGTPVFGYVGWELKE